MAAAAREEASELDERRAGDGERDRLQPATARGRRGDEVHARILARLSRGAGVRTMRGMRVTLVLAVACLFACRTRPLDEGDFTGSDSGPIRDGGIADFARPVDLSTPIDLTQPSGCASLVDCLLMCNDNQCGQQCFMQADPKAQQEFVNAETCGINYCLGQMGAPARCVQDAQGNLNDAPGVPPGDCDTCQQDVFAPLFMTQCGDPTDPACTTKACSTPFEVCLNN